MCFNRAPKHPQPATARVASRVTLGLSLVLALASPAHAQPGVPGGYPGSRERELHNYYADMQLEMMDLLDRWQRAWNRGDVDALVSLYTEDAYFTSAHAEELHGRESIRDRLAQLVPTLRGAEITPFEFEGADMLLYANGRFAYTVDEGDTSSFRHSGTAMMVFHRRRDRWYIRSQVIRLEGSAPGRPAQD
jgi:uncharacterized protein (TIGR02246 family)